MPQTFQGDGICIDNTSFLCYTIYMENGKFRACENISVEVSKRSESCIITLKINEFGFAGEEEMVVSGENIIQIIEILENAIAAKKGKWHLNFGDDYANLKFEFIGGNPIYDLQHLPDGDLKCTGSLSGFSVELIFEITTSSRLLEEIRDRIKNAI